MADPKVVATHTPVPWELNTLRGRVPAVRTVKMPHGEADTFVATIRTASGSHVCRLDFGYGQPSDEANARLIAAAPDGYDLARTIVAICDSGDTNLAQLACMENSPLVGAARALVAKVEGR